MTSEKFFEHIKEHCSGIRLEMLDRKEIEDIINTDVFNSERVIEFFADFGRLIFHREETVSGDELMFDFRPMWNATSIWQDIMGIVCLIGFVDNCGGRIGEFYLSEDGKFYNQEHKLLAENTEGFLDYITAVEYDYHHEISERTYKMLRHFGWYEGRHIDTTEFEARLAQRRITLSESQRNFFAEFSGLDFTFSGDVWGFFSVNAPDGAYKFMATAHRDGKIVGHNVIQCGQTMGSPLYINSDGIISCFGAVAEGRTTMECIHHLCNNRYTEDEWWGAVVISGNADPEIIKFCEYVDKHFILVKSCDEYTDRERLENDIRENSPVEFNTDIIADFCFKLGHICFLKHKEASLVELAYTSEISFW